MKLESEACRITSVLSLPRLSELARDYFEVLLPRSFRRKDYRRVRDKLQAKHSSTPLSVSILILLSFAPYS